MKNSIIALTKGALKLARRAAAELGDCHIYTMERFSSAGTRPIKGKLTEFMGTIFNSYESHLFIGSTGIAVRVIAPHLRGKCSDPAVLVMDEQGRHIISLLSGHLGGANRLTLTLAELLGADPVITTASDIKERTAVDMLAKGLGCHITDMEVAKIVTAMIVNDEPVSLISPYRLERADYLSYSPSEAKGAILVAHSNREPLPIPTAHLIPVNISAGVGCRAGVPGEQIISALKQALAETGIPEEALKELATVEIKAEEAGIIEAAAHFGVALKIFSIVELARVEGRFKSSPFVKKQIGVGSVAEPCAFLAGEGRGRLVLEKRAYDGVTVALFEQELEGTACLR